MTLTGHLDLKEPFASLFTQGMVVHETFRTEAGEWVLPAEVTREGDTFVHVKSGEKILTGGIEKMSKSKKNVVDPEAIIERYGADTARWFVLSDTPPDRDIEWTENGVEGAWRFTQRIWRLVADIQQKGAADKRFPADISPDALELRRATHRTIEAVTDDLKGLRFNRGIARLYELANALTAALHKNDRSDGMAAAIREAGDAFVTLIAPMMPHLAEESWKVLGHETLLVDQPWPKADPALVTSDEVTIAVQVNGKRRDEIRLPKGLSQAKVETAVLALENVKRALDGKPVRKVIVVTDRIANVVSG
jgi:leucyl-tRNA synthetase